MATFAETLKKSRKEKGLTIREVAKRSNMSAPYFSQLENGRNKKPSYEIALTLSLVLDFDLSNIDGFVKVSPLNDLIDENKRLREALEKISNRGFYTSIEVMEIAREALEGGETYGS